MIDDSRSTSEPDVSVLIVTYNSLPFVLDCLRSVELAASSSRIEVLVADNASTDGTADAVRNAAPSVVVIDMGSNLGFAAANNRLLESARGRYALLLNGDAFPDPGALDELVAFADAHPQAGVIAPRLLNADRTDQRTARSFPSPAAALWGRRSPLTRTFPNNRWSKRYLGEPPREGTEAFEVDWVSGACLMAPLDLLRRLGGLDEGFFMHFEDADLCKRIKGTGRGVWCVPTALVVHLEGASRRGWPVSQVRYFHRGAYRFYAKHYLTGSRATLRPVAAGLLSARAAGVVGVNAAARRKALRSRPAHEAPAESGTARLGTDQRTQYPPVPAGPARMEASDS